MLCPIHLIGGLIVCAASLPIVKKIINNDTADGSASSSSSTDKFSFGSKSTVSYYDQRVSNDHNNGEVEEEYDNIE